MTFSRLLSQILKPEMVKMLKRDYPELFPITDASSAIAVARTLYHNRHLRDSHSLIAAARLLDEAEAAFSCGGGRDSATNFEPDSELDADSKVWASIQYHRGEVLWYQAFADPKLTSAMIELALESYRRALRIYTFEQTPLEWAETLQSIALVTIDRVQGNRADNFREAIRLMEQTLEVFTRESHPVEWANTMINLGSAWGQLPDEDTAENMERSIDCLTKALAVHSKETNPVTWATLQVNLGTAYQHRVRGDAAENLEQTIRLYRNATEVFTLDAFPERWAMMNCNIGNAFMRRVRGNRDQNIAESIARFQAALAVTSERIPPFHHAMVRVNLAGAYLKSKNAGQNAEAAIEACERALEICRDNYPVEEAMIHFMLGNAYRVAPAQAHQSRLRKAATHYANALKIMDPLSTPALGLQYSTALAETLLTLDDVAGAAEALTGAMAAFETLYRQNITVESRQSAIERGAPACFLAAYCAALADNPRNACEFLERGRTRILADRLAIDKVVIEGIRSDWKHEFVRLSESIRELDYHMQRQGMTPSQFLNTVSELKQARNNLDELIATIRDAYPEFLRETATFDDVHKMIPDPQTALIEICVTTHGTAVVIVLHPSFADSAVNHRVFPSFNLASLEESVRNYTKHYAVFKASEKNKQTIESFENSLLQTVQPIYDAIFHGVDDFLERHAIRHLILAPHRFLHILPLHLMRSTLHEKPVFLFDKYTVSYTPGATALVHIAGSAPGAADSNAASQKRAKLMAVANPTGDLLFADAETESVSAFFDNSDILSGANASVEQVISHSARAEYLHFACHGLCDLEHSDQTGLLLAGNEAKCDEACSRATLDETDTSATFDGKDTRATLDEADNGEMFNGGSDAETFDGDSSGAVCNEAGSSPTADFQQPDSSAERAIFFHPEPESATRQHGKLLSLIDICHRLDLRHAALVFLSACESGLVVVTGAADEVVGLPSAFLQAGARAVVSSLWLVDDAHSRDFVERFYRYHISENLSAAAALQQAQRDMMAAGFSPYYWAGFIVTGIDSRIIQHRPP